jgi:periplasmic protein TonB
MDTLYQLGLRHGRKLLILVAALVHLAFILLVTFRLSPTQVAEREAAEVFKMVDVAEYAPPPPKAKEIIQPESTVNVAIQAPVASEVIETEKIVVETTGAVTGNAGADAEVIDYVPQHKISRIPVIPAQKVLDRIQYPELAAKQGIEAVVYLELHIDRYGKIRNVIVLKDPGYGFAQAAIKALEGIVCQPAAANGEAVAVKFRYPVRFTLRR